ncbi:MAG: hypothetical protein ACUVWK_01955 [Nitrososphaerales archaeon]
MMESEEMSKSNDREDWLKALLYMGFILFASTILSGLPIILIGMLIPGGFGIDAGVAALGAMQVSGLIAMVYATIKIKRLQKKASKIRTRTNMLSSCLRHELQLAITPLLHVVTIESLYVLQK